MAFSVHRVGQFSGGRADRVAIAQFAANSPQVITLIWNGNQVKHSLFALLPNGSLVETEVDAKAGGPDLAVASFSKTRLISMHRSGPAGALKFEAWNTNGVFALIDDQVWVADHDPEMVPFGADPGILTGAPPIGASSMARVEASQRLGAKETEEGQHQAPMPKLQKATAAGGVVIKIGSKAGHAVIASQTVVPRLRVSLWGFDNGGQIPLQVGKYAEADGGPATAVSVAKVKEHWSSDGSRVTAAEVVTASSGDNHALRLMRWRVDLGAQGVPASIQLLSEHTAAESVVHVSAIPVLALGGTQVATAVQLVSGTLKVIGWKMESNGGIKRWVDASGGGITAVSAAPVGGRNLVTAVREADGRFKASYWRFPANETGTLEHRGDAVEGPVGFQLRCAHVPHDSQLGDTVAAVQSEDGKLHLFRYRVTDG